ncbi:MAG: hypothetical protein ABI045_05890 [Flavobacteriales bacterium]
MSDYILGCCSLELAVVTSSARASDMSGWLFIGLPGGGGVCMSLGFLVFGLLWG